MTSFKEPNFQGFADAIMEHWPMSDVDGADLQELAVKFGIIAPIPGGFDPEEHDDEVGYGAEPGDPWFQFTYGRPPRTGMNRNYERVQRVNDNGEIFWLSGDENAVAAFGGEATVTRGLFIPEE